jgi:hypothetical protein
MPAYPGISYFCLAAFANVYWRATTGPIQSVPVFNTIVHEDLVWRCPSFPCWLDATRPVSRYIVATFTSPGAVPIESLIWLGLLPQIVIPALGQFIFCLSHINVINRT